MMEREDNTDELCSYGNEKCSLEHPGEMVTDLKTSIKVLSAKVNEQDQRKCEVKDKLQQLRERISHEGVDVSVQELMSLLRSLKELEKQESEVRSSCNVKRSALEDAVSDLEEKVAMGCHGQIVEEDLDGLLVKSLDNLTLEKKELAALLRDIVSLKRQIDDVGCQSERLQYERKFSELNICIQEKLQQTRKLYATYNALIEIKDLMLKETSLLNSIGSQKIGNVQLGLQEEQRLRDISKEKYIAAAAEQRKCYTILRAFQEECTKNDRLRSQISALKTSDSKEEVE